MSSEEIKIAYICSQCGALHDRASALNMVLAKNGFTPVKIQQPKEEPKPVPKPVMSQRPAKPQIKEAQYIDDDETEEIEDLRID